jgi:hypothetical protein
VIVLPRSSQVTVGSQLCAKLSKTLRLFAELNDKNRTRAKDFVIETIKTIRFTSHLPSHITLIKAPVIARIRMYAEEVHNAVNAERDLR